MVQGSDNFWFHNKKSCQNLAVLTMEVFKRELRSRASRDFNFVLVTLWSTWSVSVRRGRRPLGLTYLWGLLAECPEQYNAQIENELFIRAATNNATKAFV